MTTESEASTTELASGSDSASVGGFNQAPSRAGFELRRFAELMAVTGLAVAQPVLGIFGSDPATFVSLDAGRTEILLFVGLVCLVPALVLWILTALTGRRTVRWWSHRLAVGGAAGALALHAVRDATGWSASPALAAATVAGVLAVALAGRSVVREILRWLALAVPALAALFLFGPVGDLVWGSDDRGSQGGVPDDFDLVMIVLDELPTASLLDGDGEVDAELFPNFARLADRSTWYRNHTTVAPFTAVAVPSLLTGQLPDDPKAAPTIETHPDNLLNWVSGAGSVAAVESVTSLCPDECAGGEFKGQPGRVVLRTLLSDAVEIWVKRTSPDRSQATEVDFAVQAFPTDAAAVDRLAEWGPELSAEVRGPRVDFVHVLTPHQPFVRNADGSAYEGHEPPRGVEFFLWSDAHATEVGRLRHQLQLRAVDTAMGVVLDRLDDSGRSESAALAVVADHGIGFEVAGPIRGISPSNAAQVAWVPFFLAAPGQDAGEIVDRSARSIDVAPTIAGLFGAELPWDVDGVDLAKDGPGSGEAAVLDWSFNEGFEVGPDGYIALDGEAGYEALLDFAPVGGAPGDDFRQFRFGQRPELIGSRVEDHEAAAPVSVPLAWEFPTDGTLDSDADITQTYVSVRIQGAPESDLAIAVDGVIGAVVPWAVGPFGISDAWGIVPAEIVPDGGAEVELFDVTGSADAPQLAPIEPSELVIEE